MNAVMNETNVTSTRFDRADEFGLCPECGAVMNEMERYDAGTYTYIWLKCSKSDCDGQWLQKKPRQSLKSGYEE